MPSTKEKLWLEEYLGPRARFNATEAARLAGYKWPEKIGPRKKKKFEKEIQERLKEKALDADQVLALLSEQATGNMAEFIHWDGSIDWQAVKGKGHLIKKVSQTYGEKSSSERIELHDSQAALDKIARVLGMYKDRMQTLNIDVGSLTDDQLERIAAGEDPLHVIHSTSGKS